jgi:FMN phosphatase YigB (HAD superfamily)
VNVNDDLVLLLDVDNTLLNNDQVTEDLRQHLIEQFGPRSARLYWTLFEDLRAELGYTDYLGALQQYRADVMNDPSLLRMSSFLLDYPFSDRLYPAVMQVLSCLQRQGRTVILSDGDVVFQPRKIQRSGLWDAVGGRVLVYIHKEQMVDKIVARYPASHYVMVDDKLRVLAAMKAVLGDRLTTVFARQGHYALNSENIRLYPAADITVECIGDLIHTNLSAFSESASSGMHKE